ncbi:MAG TPA: hypothetical protein VMX15_04970 [Candidatus Heimdallarchaeota archaeon]|nr:hypothetical protein [Candidatus Heimdallarchaeota archaeon]
MASPLEKEFEFYLENQEQLVKEYEGKVLVIKNCAVIGVYDSEQEALAETTKDHELGTFLVQRCEQGVDSVTQTFHSRAVFV